MKKILSLLLITALIFSVSSSSFAENTSDTIPEETSGTVFYVSASASSGGDGSFEKPFQSIENAKRAVRSADKNKPITVYVMGGDYYFKSSMVFDAQDSGSEKAPITYKAYNGEKPVFHGSVEIPARNITKLEDETLLNRFQATVRDKIYVMKLPSDVESNMGNLFRFGVGSYAHTYNFNTIDVFNNGELMPMSQWPNVGFVDVESITDGSPVKVQFGDSIATHFNNWKFSEDIIMSYYTRAGYEHYYSPVSGFSAKEKVINIPNDQVARTPSLDRMGPSSNARVVILNMLEEIDMPGEWVIDRANKQIYIYPEGGKVNGKMSVSLLNEAIVRFNGASNITFEGITVGYGRNDAIEIINKSSNIVIKDCDVCNVGSSGIEIRESNNISVIDSDIYNVGSSGVYIVSCGDKIALGESGIVVANNDIFNIGRLKKCATACVITEQSCGVDIRNNKMHRVPHQAVWVDGSVIVRVDANEIYQAVRETMDAGALYVNGDPIDWGVEFTNNFIHDVTNELSGRGTTHGTYADAQHHNVKMENNIFYNIGNGAGFQNGGSFGTLANNIFIKCPTPTIYTDYEKQTHWGVSERGTALSKVAKAKYLERFPDMQRWLEFDADEKLRRKTVGSSFYNNVSIGSVLNVPANKSLNEYGKRIDNNIGMLTAADFGFDETKPDYDYDFSYTKDAPVYDKVSDLEVIDFDNIGVNRVTELTPAKLIGPENGATGIEGNNAILTWRGVKGAYRYRVIVSIDENFEALVYDKIVNETSCTINSLKYGVRKYYWKVIPVKSAKSEVVVDAEPQVFTFTTAKTEALNKTELRSKVMSLGNNYVGFGYPNEIVTQVKEAKDTAQTILDSKRTKQSNVRAISKKLDMLTTQMYDSAITRTIDIDEFLGDSAGWVPSSKKSSEIGDDYVKLNTISSVLSYGGNVVNPGEMVRFTLKFNPTGYQSVGIHSDTKGRLWTVPGYSAVMRLGFIELQRYNYNAEGEIEGGIIKHFPSKGALVANMWMMVEFGYTKVHNGVRVVLKVDGTTLIDYVDTTPMAVTEPGYFRIENGSNDPMTAGTVTNDTTKSGVTDM